MRQQIPAVFSESTVPDGPAEQVARETGAAYGGVLYVDSISTRTGRFRPSSTCFG
jgi:manganese/iron transport system substrate-binding protein